MNLEGQTGGKVIGAGTYGCVNKPAIQCHSDSFRVPYSISKRMSYANALIELRIGKKIESIDPYHYFTLKAPKMCIPGDLKPEDKDIRIMKSRASEGTTRKCTRPITPKDRLLIMEDAGIDLHILNKQLNPSAVASIERLYKTTKSILSSELHTIHTSLFLYKEIYRILLGIAVLNQKGYVHNDIKRNNIMIHPRTGQLRLIDYSLTSNPHDFFESLRGFCREEMDNYPPEICLLSAFHRDGTIPFLGERGGVKPMIRRILLDILQLGKAKMESPMQMRKLIDELRENGEDRLAGFLRVQGDIEERNERNRELILMLLDLQYIRTETDFKRKLFFSTDSYMCSNSLSVFIKAITRHHQGIRETPLVKGMFEILTEMKDPRMSRRLTSLEAIRKLDALRLKVPRGIQIDSEFRRVHKIPEEYRKLILESKRTD
jgi:serine/threonine protein kinase